MEKLLGKDKNNTINLIFTVAIFIAGAAVILYYRLRNLDIMVGPYIWPDQMGYYTHAAVLSGLPWYETTESWYAWGTSLILALIYKITTVGYLAYRYAVMANAFVGVAGYILGIIFVKQLNNKIDTKLAIIGSASAFLCTSYIVQSEIVWAETYVYTIFMAVLVVAMHYAKKPTVLRAAALTTVVGILFIFHNRCIVIILAVLMYIVLMAIVKKDKKILIQLAVACLLILVLYRGNAMVKYKLKGIEGVASNVTTTVVADNSPENDGSVIIKDEHIPTAEFSEESVSNGNDFSGRLFNFYLPIYFKEARIGLVESFLGETWYLIFSGFMLGWFGITCIFRKSIGVLSKNRTVEEKQEACGFAFILISLLGMLFLSSINALWFPEYVLDNNGSVQLEMLYYGRYVEMFTVPLVLIGFAWITKKEFEKKEILEIVIGIAYMILVALMVNYEANLYPDASINIVSVAGVYHWIDKGYIPMTIMAIGVGAVIYALCKLSFRVKNIPVSVVLVMAAAAVMSTFSIKGLDSVEEVITAMEMSLKNYDDMVGLLEKNDDITLIVDSEYTAVDRYYRIRTRSTTTPMGCDSRYIDYNDQCFFLVEPFMVEQIMKMYSERYDNLYITMCGDYPLIIKGDELAQRLMAQGYEVTR